jgi:hypothetical protein
VDWLFVFSCVAHNLIRLPNLIAQPPASLRSGVPERRLWASAMLLRASHSYKHTSDPLCKRTPTGKKRKS